MLSSAECKKLNRLVPLNQLNLTLMHLGRTAYSYDRHLKATYPSIQPLLSF